MSPELGGLPTSVQECAMDPKTRPPQDDRLDEALEATFPASDPIAMTASNRHLQDAEPSPARRLRPDRLKAMVKHRRS